MRVEKFSLSRERMRVDGESVGQTRWHRQLGKEHMGRTGDGLSLGGQTSRCERRRMARLGSGTRNEGKMSSSEV